MMIPQDLLDQVPVPVPTHHQTATPTHVLPLPTVTPDIPRIYHQYSTEAGHKTLWCVAHTPVLCNNSSIDIHRVVCVVMGVSSLAFYGMAMRVPVVSNAKSINEMRSSCLTFCSKNAFSTCSRPA
jgi:hypothetical protein